MTDTQEGIVELIRSTLTVEKRELPIGFSLREAINIMNEHQIATLIYDGALRCGFSSELPEMELLFNKYCQNFIVSEQQLANFTAVTSAFSQAGIDFLPLKGCVLKWLYPRHELRIMTDSDILVREEQYEQAHSIMRSLGFSEGKETDHELPWMRDGHLIELHKRLIPSYNKDYNAYFGDGWQFAHPTEQPHRYEMSNEDTFIFLVAHFAKHYRDCGIGCRHLADLWVCRRAWPNMDEDYIINKLKTLKLDTLYHNLIATIDAWFADGSKTEVTDIITETIFRSGSYGETSLSMLSLGLKETKLFGHSKNIKFLHWLHAVFCPLRVMSFRYPVLKRFPVLLPLFWFIRIAETLLYHKDRIETVKQDAQAFRAEEIDAYQESLHKVGLDYHF